MLRFEDIRFDCDLYNGYKPCRFGNECAGCPHYSPREDASEETEPGEAVMPPQPAVSRGEGDAERILIIKTGAMGDVLRTTTLLPSLKRAYPESFITWVTDHSALPLLEANPLIDELLEMSDATVEAVARKDFDLLLNFEKEKEPLALAGRVRAGTRRGFGPTRWNTPTVYNRESQYALLLGLSDELKFRVNMKTYPEIIAEMACLPYARDPYILELTATSRRCQAMLESRLSGDGRLRIGINTGCGAVFRTKQWTFEGWVGLVHFLQEHASADILLLGGQAERDLNREILCHTSGVIDTGTDNTLEEFFGVVNACDIVVTSDSLAMHIAVALRKYVVALFGSTSHVEVDLFDRGEKVVTDFACSPCYLKTCDKVPTCMQALTGRTVGEAVLRGSLAIRGRTAQAI